MKTRQELNKLNNYLIQYELLLDIRHLLAIIARDETTDEMVHRISEGE
jgi:hypothetical protein